ncbi:DUF4309 domain-containing protein [Shimazuella kribbensis]|uniref:DUF4309 domain-containing protein n=1 Tax=Shimazuella kribbensis TaxID=139808 RepID=UPI00040D16AD|nr:DUF4309 domain-containing protein [Shimazuella kribbensis]
MKKGFIYILIAMFTLFLTACSSNDSNVNSDFNSSSNTDFSDQTNQTTNNQSSDDSWVSDQHKYAEQNMSSAQKLINDITKASEQGYMYPNSSVALGDTSQSVINAYGNPESGDAMNMDYPSKNMSFDVENGTVVAIISKDPKLESITKDDVTSTIGKPSNKEFEGGSEYYDYNVGNYLLSFAFAGDNIAYVYVK